MGDPVFSHAHLGLIEIGDVAMNARPAMCPLISRAIRSMFRGGLEVSGPMFVHPAGLRNADPVGILEAMEELKERDLDRRVKLIREREVRRCAPKEEAPGKREKTERAREVRVSNRRRQAREGLEGEQILHA